jgi:hypothetical protein
MDAPAKLSALDGLQDNLHPYIRPFAAARAAVPDGIGWLAPNRFFALDLFEFERRFLTYELPFVPGFTNGRCAVRVSHGWLL